MNFELDRTSSMSEKIKTKQCLLSSKVSKCHEISTILLIIFWYFLIIQLRSESPKVKRYLISSITNLVHELPHELPNDFRIRILGNQEILEKCQMWVETQTSAQSPFQKLNIDNSCKKHTNLDATIEALSNFTVFLYFVPNILSRIVAFEPTQQVS